VLVFLNFNGKIFSIPILGNKLKGFKMEEFFEIFSGEGGEGEGEGEGGKQD